jgi:hypothetical protein
VAPYGYTADLNGDDTLDYILMVPYGAVGSIGGGLCDVVFVLSAAGQYRISMLTSIYPGPDDFLSLSGDGRFHFLYTSVYGSTEEIRSRDGKYHNYWVYDLVSIDGATLKWDHSALPGFPKWIWFTFRSNHEETDLLTDEQKRQLFSPAQECLISTVERPCPNYFKN